MCENHLECSSTAVIVNVWLDREGGSADDVGAFIIIK